MTKDYVMGTAKTLERLGAVKGSILHCIGLDENQEFDTRGGVVHCHRNYFATYNDKDFTEEVADGRMSTIDNYFYRVTEDGFDWLSKLCGFEIKERR